MEKIDNLTPIFKEGSEEVRVNVVESVISSMNMKMDALSKDLYTVCIYRVLDKYRKSKEEAYTPRVVSIGPLHHGKSHLQAMDEYKFRYLHSFIRNFGIGIDKLVMYTSNKEDQVRGCYEDTSKFESEKFCQMILLDGIFVVQLFVKKFIQMRDPGDMLLENQWMASDLMHDMLLLENQLPLNYIIGLFQFVDGSRIGHNNFYELSCDYYKGVGHTKKLKLTDDCKRSRHLVEFLANLHRPSSTRQKSGNGRCEYTTSASQLYATGVRFEHNMGDLFEISYDKESGRLKLPILTVNDKAETYFRNLIAYEQCGYYEKYITSYVIFMKSLINTADDVKLLVDSKIIVNLLGGNQQVADLFNNLCKEEVDEMSDLYYADICEDLYGYSQSHKGWMYTWYKWKTSWLKWKLMLIMKYFTNPWSAIGFLAATIVVICTVVQTVWSILGP